MRSNGRKFPFPVPDVLPLPVYLICVNVLIRVVVF